MKQVITMRLLILVVFIDLNSQNVEQIQDLRFPENYSTPIAVIDRDAVIIEGVPAYTWSYGSSPTAMAMLAGYYDRNGFPDIYMGSTNDGVAPLANSVYGVGYGGSTGQCPISASRNGLDGRTINGHCDDYYVDYLSNEDPYLDGFNEEHSYGDCIADYTGTSHYYQWWKLDGQTSFYSDTNPPDNAPVHDFTECENYNPASKDGAHGLKMFFNARGYSVSTCYNQRIFGFDGIEAGFSWDDYKNEIDNNRPVIIQTTGLSFLGIGYNTAEQKMYIYDTSDYEIHEMIWGGVYIHPTQAVVHKFVTIVYPEPNVGIEDTIILDSGPLSFSPNSDLLYQASFIDFAPYGDEISEWNWSIKLYHLAGIYTYIEETTTGSTSTYLDTEAGDLSNNYNWLRASDGSIKGDLILSAIDTDGIMHTLVENVQVGIAPEQPTLSSIYQMDDSIIFELNSYGASSYEIYYGSTNGGPYDGIGASEGDSPVVFNTTDLLSITDLLVGNQYYFIAKGVNAFGTSFQSEEIAFTPVITSGIIADNVVWSNKIITNSTIVIPSSKSLTISANTEVILSGNAQIVCQNGGALTIENNSTISGRVATIISGESNPVIISGNQIEVYGNLTIGNNVQFTANDDEYWDGLYLFDDQTVSINKVIFKNCNLKNENGELQLSEVIFQASYISNINATLHMNDCIVDGLDYGVYCSNNAQVNIITSTIFNSNIGIMLNNCTDYIISDCNVYNNSGIGINVNESFGKVNEITLSNIYNNDGDGIRFYASKGEVQSSNIYSNLRGITCYRGSIVEILKDPNSSSWIDDSTISENDLEELLFLDDCTIMLDLNRNKIIDSSYNNGTWDQYLVRCPNMSHSRVFRNNYWGYNNSLCAILPPVDRIYPSIIDPAPGETGFILSPAWDPGQPREGDKMAVELLYIEADLAVINNENSLAEYLFKQIIAQYPGSRFLKTSAKRLIGIIDDYCELQSYYELEPNLHQNTEISTFARYLANYCNIKMQRYEDAIINFENIITDPPTEIDSVMAVIDAGYTYLLMVENSPRSDFVGKMAGLIPNSRDDFEQRKNLLLSSLFGDPVLQQENDQSEDNLSAIPVLHNNYPNPFNPTTTIKFGLSEESDVILSVYNVKGQKINNLAKKKYSKGYHTVIWDGKDNSGNKVSSGIYFYKLKANNKTIAIKKCLLLK